MRASTPGSGQRPSLAMPGAGETTRCMGVVRRVRTAVLVALLALSLINLAMAIVVVLRPDEVRFGEGVVYGQPARLVHGEALYQPIDAAPYGVAGYTPLYYAVAALPRLIAGTGFLPGRAVSLAAEVLAA